MLWLLGAGLFVNCSLGVVYIEPSKPSMAEVMNNEFKAQRSERAWGQFFEKIAKNKKLSLRVKGIFSGYTNARHDEYVKKIRESGFPPDIIVSLENLYEFRKTKEDILINEFKKKIFAIVGKYNVENDRVNRIFSVVDDFGRRKQALSEIDELKISEEDKSILIEDITEFCAKGKGLAKSTRKAREEIAKTMG